MSVVGVEVSLGTVASRFGEGRLNSEALMVEGPNGLFDTSMVLV
jgi:hypothetical protein